MAALLAGLGLKQSRLCWPKSGFGKQRGVDSQSSI
jgi:hypothetical protein